jgi:anti-anti-sigma factor
VLTVTVHNLAGIIVLRCHGRLVSGEESVLLCAAVRHHEHEVILDLAEVTAIDAGGIGALVSLQAAGIYLKLLNPTEPVRTVLRLTGMDSLFEICDDQSLAEPRPQRAPEMVPLLA